MRILLISSNRLTQPYPVYPLGLDHVLGALAPRHEVRRLDLCGTPDDDPVERALAEFAPELIGISVRNMDNTDAADAHGFADDVRRLVARLRGWTRAPIVLGGSGYSLFPRQMLEHVGADFGLAGEGEHLDALVTALEAGASPDPVPGLVRPGATEVRPATWAGPFARRLPQAPEAEFYLRCGGMLNLQTKRGCPFRCSYCTYPLLEGHALRLIPPAEVAETARGLQERGARYLFFTDSSFNADADHSLAVAGALRAAGVTVPWGAFFSPLPPPDGYYARLAEAGCRHVEFGTDSLADAMLVAYRKPYRAAGVTAAHAQAVAAGLHLAHYLLLGGPGEDGHTLGETFERLEHLERCALFFFCGVRIYPGTELWRRAVDEGQVLAEDSLLEPVFYRPTALGLEEIAERVRQRAAGRPNWVLGAGGDDTARVLERMYARGRVGPLWEWLIR